MVKVRSIIEITEDDLDYEELQASHNPNNTSGILSHKVIPYKDLTDDDLETMFQYSKLYLEWLLKIRPNFIKRCHPEVIT